MYGEIEYTYDANGNLTQKKVRSLSGVEGAAVNYMYNAENRLVKVEDDLTKVIMAEYGYDPFGRRLWKDVFKSATEPLQRTYFCYADEGLIAEYDANGQKLRSYGYFPGSPVPVFLNQQEAYYWYQNNHFGTPQQLVALNGAVVWAADYQAFGRAVVSVNTIVNPLRFPGQYEDPETGLHYNWYRYYDPDIGRYLSPDPVGFGGGDFNLYGYAQNNPIQQYDAVGLYYWGAPPQTGSPILDMLQKVAIELENGLNPPIQPEIALLPSLEQDMLDLQNQVGFNFDQLYERADKHLRYWFAKTFLIHDPNWQLVLDDWYKETTVSTNRIDEFRPDQSYLDALRQTWDSRYPFPQDGKFPRLHYRGENNSLNQDIKNNPGFRVLLQCWVHYRRVAEKLGIQKPPILKGDKLDPPMKFGNIRPNGFDWDFIVIPWEEAGGWDAYLTSMAQLLGSYQVEIAPVSEKPDTYFISITDPKGWASATRRPDFMRKLLNMGERQSVYFNEPRGSYPGRFFMRGGTIFLQFEFEVEESSCAECKLPIELEKEILRALKKP